MSDFKAWSPVTYTLAASMFRIYKSHLYEKTIVCQSLDKVVYFKMSLDKDYFTHPFRHFLGMHVDL